VSIEQARDDMRRVAATMAQEFPASNKGWSAQVVSVYDSMLEAHVRPSLWALLASVVTVLLIGCANVASMLLARSVGRQREFALRAALGAGRTRLARQIVTENLMLALAGGAGGLLLAVLAVERLQELMPQSLPRLDDVRIDAVVFGVGVCLSLASGLVMGLVPAMRASRLALLPSLAQHGKGTAGTSKPRLRHCIVAGQMTLATTLLVVAALLLQSLMSLQRVPLGFDAAGVVTARISLPRDSYPDAGRADAFWRQLLGSLRAVPQVQAAALGLSAPFAPGVRVSGQVADQSHLQRSSAAGASAVQQVVSPGYFQTLGMPLLAGREFTAEDRFGAPAVAVVSAGVARSLWPNESPIGKRIDWKGEQQAEVVGVVGDVRGAGPRGPRGGTLDEDPASAVYFASTQQPQHTMTVLVRTARPVAEVSSALGLVVRDIDAMQPVYQVRALPEWVDESLAQARFTSTLIAGFAAAALLLVAVGVYGVLAYSVAQRTQEIGVRIAVGAEREQIVALVLRGSMSWALGGIAVGLVAAMSFSRVLAPLLFGVAPRDPLTFGAAACILAAVALLACVVPASRATRVDPIVALRAE
jgi:putative ABC transport system permease protein